MCVEGIRQESEGAELRDLICLSWQTRRPMCPDTYTQKACTTSRGLEHAQCVTLNVIASLDVASLGARQARDGSGAGVEHGPKGRLVIG